jgi:hypothetical protein
MIKHARNCPLPCARKLDKEHGHENKQKPIERNHENKLTLLWNQEVKTDRNILIINRINNPKQ